MKSLHIALVAAFALLLVCPPSSAATYVGTYEISYLYNSMGDPNNLNRPVGSLPIGTSMSSVPIKVSLAPGSYYTSFVVGRITGNDFFDFGIQEFRDAYDDYVPLLNPGSIYPEMGFNGGNTDPTHNAPEDGWWHMIAGWVGASETDGSVFWGGNFAVAPGQSLWLYWTDPYIPDNLGGVTVEVWQTAAAPVPEPGTLALVGLGLAGLGVWRRRQAPQRDMPVSSAALRTIASAR